LKSSVLDSFAVLALLFGEKGCEKVMTLLEKAAQGGQTILMASPNWAEVRYIVERKSGAARWLDARKNLSALPIRVVAVDQDVAERAGEIKAQHRMGLADAFAAALAHQTGSDLYTGDPEFEEVEKQIRVVWL